MELDSSNTASPLAFTSFHSIPPLPLTTTMSTYLHKEEQFSWSRPVSHKRKHDAIEDPAESSTEEKRGRNTIVIHPGSRWLRIGRASDILPISLPNIIARRKANLKPAELLYGIRRPKPLRPDEDIDAMDETENEAVSENKESAPAADVDEGTARIAAFRTAFKDRLKLFGVRYQPGASESGTNFNRVQTSEKIADHNDSQRITWIMNAPPGKDTFFGHDVFLLSDNLMKEFEVRWPFRGIRLNCDDRTELPGILSDISAIWTWAITEELGIKRSEIKNMGAVLVVPDLADRTYIRELVQILLVDMGFTQVAVHQECVSAGYGAQMSNACVVDVGALKTSITCIEDGLIVPDTRLTLNLGGDDITEVFYVLLQQSCFPYKEMDLTHLYDWNLMQDLKHQYCTFIIDISGARPYDLYVRKPGVSTEKYKIKMYDEYMAAPLVLFETGVVWYAEKRKRWAPVWNRNVQDDLSNPPLEEITFAMNLSTAHILQDVARETEEAIAQAKASQGEEDTKESSDKPLNLDIPSKKRVVTNFRTESPPLVLPEGITFPGGLPIDVPFEASKLPLDVAIFNSARGAAENATAPIVSKFLENVLLVGGGSLIPGLPHYLQQRLHQISLSFYGAELERITVVQNPKELDPRVIIWKGASILARLDTSSEFWVSAKDWDRLGMRAFRDRSLFL
ncbi:actin-like ATPase domain-containing protein [Serendipita vermifera]|nr:actin-like ATPase domain-containing protein [Serendipita vermifera]